MPELCQTPHSCLFWVPLQWAKDKAQSQYLGHPPSSCHIPGLEIALPAFPPRLPSTKGPGPLSQNFPTGRRQAGNLGGADRALCSPPSHSDSIS